MIDTRKRNFNILKAALDGVSYDDIGEKYNITYASASGCVRDALQLLKDYGADVPATSDRSLLAERKEDILLAIKKTKIPKTHISWRIRSLLAKQFGDDFIRHPKKVADAWDNGLKNELHRTGDSRDRQCILRWLASEGYHRGNFIDQKHMDILFETLGEHLKTLNVEGKVNIKVTDAKPCTMTSHRMLVDFSISDNEADMRADRMLDARIFTL